MKLEQVPILEGALVALDNRTGEVRAMVGGYSFARSKFNRATQAYRQMGSTVKPFLYTAAIDRGLTPTTILDRRTHRRSTPAPASRRTRRGNYDRKFEGTMTLRRALEQSRNIPAVKVIDMLGPGPGGGLRAALRLQPAVPAVPVDGARRAGSHAASN